MGVRISGTTEEKNVSAIVGTVIKITTVPRTVAIKALSTLQAVALESIKKNQDIILTVKVAVNGIFVRQVVNLENKEPN